MPDAPSAPGPTAAGGLVPASAYASPVGSGDYDSLLAQLKSRKMVSYRQESFGNGHKFICTVQTAPGYERQYEATALDCRSAILAVLEQMDRTR